MLFRQVPAARQASLMRIARKQRLDEIVRLFRVRLEQEWPKGETDATGVEDMVARIERELLRGHGRDAPKADLPPEGQSECLPAAGLRWDREFP